MRFLPRRSGHGALELQLRNEIDRANRYRYYLGVAGWERGASQEVSPSVSVVGSPEELWAEARALVDDPHDFSVLDIGSGVRPFALRRYPVHVCLEPFEPYVNEVVRRFRDHPSIVVLKGSAPESLEMFPDGAFDAVVMADVIEHLAREPGRQTLDHAVRIARNQVHVFTPDGFMPQHVGPLDDDVWGYVGNEVQTHVSGWTAVDFDGWRVIRCAQYQETYGAIWATFSHARRGGPPHASLFLTHPFDPSDNWTAWLEALERRLTFCQATIHPELAPWSFRTRPMPRLPAALTSVGINALDLAPDGNHQLGRNCRVCGEPAPSRSVVVLRDPKDIAAAVTRASANRVLGIAEDVTSDHAREGEEGGAHYRVASMGDPSAAQQAIDWLLET